MTETEKFVKANRGKRVRVGAYSGSSREGTIEGVSIYDTVIVQFEVPVPPSGIGQSQEWPMDGIELL